MKTKNTSGGGDVFLSLLGVLFIGLKLTGYIAWPWFWVLSPIRIPLALILLGVVAFVVAKAIFRKWPTFSRFTFSLLLACS